MITERISPLFAFDLRSIEAQTKKKHLQSTHSYIFFNSAYKSFSRTSNMRRIVCYAQPITILSTARLQSLSKATEETYAKLQADPESALGSAEYQLLKVKLAKYSELQGQYAVKQSEMERTKRAANVCGLDMPEPKRRE